MKTTEITVINEQFYNPIKGSFIRMLDEKAFKREVNFAIQILKKNQYLQTCSQESILDAVLNISQTSLTLNPVLNYAYLVPHKGKCVLYPSYQGLCKLATETGSIKSIECQLIYNGDDVLLDLSSEKKIEKHIPYFLNNKPQGEIVAGYSIATLENGIKHIEVMSRQQILDVRNYSESFSEKQFLICVIHFSSIISNPNTFKFFIFFILLFLIKSSVKTHNWR